MRPVAAKIVATCAAALVLSGCGWNQETEPRLLNIKSNITGPDEFAILPNKPLTLPQAVACILVVAAIVLTESRATRSLSTTLSKSLKIKNKAWKTLFFGGVVSHSFSAQS